MHYDEHYIREHWGKDISDGLGGWLSKEMIAVLDALFAHGPLEKLPKGWVGHNVVLSVQSAKGLVRRGLAEIKGKSPHERLYVTHAGKMASLAASMALPQIEEPRLRFGALHLIKTT
jgi:hypothetical protein